MSDLPPPDTRSQPLPSPGDRRRRSRRTPLLVTLGTVAAAALIVGGIAVGSGGGDDDSAPAPSAGTASEPSPSSAPTATPDTAPAPTVEATTTSTSVPGETDADPNTVAAANVGVLAEEERPACPVDTITMARLAGELGGPRAGRAIGDARLTGSTMFRQRLTGAAAIVCSAGTREQGVALYLGPLGKASLRAWTTEALLNDNPRLRELTARGDATVVAVDSSTKVGDFSLAQKGAAWTDGTLAVMLVGVSFDGQRVDADPGAAGRALTGAAGGIVTQLADIELADAPPPVPLDEPLDTSTALTNLLTITERGRSGEALECPVSIAALDAFNEPVKSTFLNRILDESSGVMGAAVELYQRRGPTLLRCTAGVENGLVGIYLGTLHGAAPGSWLSTILPTISYKQVGAAHQGTVFTVRLRDPATSIHGAAWTDGNLIVMLAGVGSPDKLDFTPSDAATGLHPALQAIVTELQDR